MKRIVSIGFLLLWAPSAFASAFMSPSAQSTNYALEIRLGPYKPSISSNDAVKDWYNLNFPEKSSIINGHPLMYGVETDWYLFDRFGLTGIYGRIGYWKASGSTRACSLNTTCNFDNATATNKDGNGTQNFSALPLSMGVVYRATFIKEKWSIPLVPYGKAGIDYWFWWNTANGSTSYSGGKRAKGGTWGWHATAGLALNLDFIEPNTAAQAQQASRLNDTYLFFEAQWNFADDFGQSNSKPEFSSAPQYTMGLTFEFY